MSCPLTTSCWWFLHSWYMDYPDEVLSEFSKRWRTQGSGCWLWANGQDGYGTSAYLIFRVRICRLIFNSNTVWRYTLFHVIFVLLPQYRLDLVLRQPRGWQMSQKAFNCVFSEIIEGGADTIANKFWHWFLLSQWLSKRLREFLVQFPLRRPDLMPSTGRLSKVTRHTDWQRYPHWNDSFRGQGRDAEAEQHDVR
jgi:hypothetical protein